MGESLRPTRSSGSNAAPLAPDQIEAWRTQGAIVVDGIVPVELVHATRDAAVSAWVAPPDDDPGDFGDGGASFPGECVEFNALTLHPRLLAAVSQLLGVHVRQLRLNQSDLWVKRGRTTTGAAGPADNADQRMHVDYPNHTLVHPSAFDSPDAVEVIVYFDRSEECRGETRVVLRESPTDPAYSWPIVGTPGIPPLPWINDRVRAEADVAERDPVLAAWRAEHLYARERAVEYSPAAVLFYRHDVWHRGTPVAAGALRVAQNLTFRRADADWVMAVQPGWAWSMYRPSLVLERLVAEASVDQRCVLGVPEPGHRYWTTATVDAFEARYAALGMDVSEYRAALAHPASVDVSQHVI